MQRPQFLSRIIGGPAGRFPVRSIAHDVVRKKLTYLDADRFRSLYKCIDLIDKNSVAGDCFEFGVALGGSGICLADALTGTRSYYGFDVFGMIPPPDKADGDGPNARYEVISSGKADGIGGDKYYGYVEDLIEVVRSNFASFNLPVDGKRIRLVQGLFSDTLPQVSDHTLALVHIDCDWYDPVTECLEFAWPRLSPGGFIILDDYNAWEGCTRATDEFVARTRGAVVVRHKPHAVITK